MDLVELNANIIDLTARIESLHAQFMGYIRVNERRTVSCEIEIQYYESYLDILRKKFSSLPDGISKQTEEYLAFEYENAEKSILHFQEWQELADSVEEFENGSKFEQQYNKNH